MCDVWSSFVHLSILNVTIYLKIIGELFIIASDTCYFARLVKIHLDI